MALAHADLSFRSTVDGTQVQRFKCIIYPILLFSFSSFAGCGQAAAEGAETGAKT